MEMFVRIYDTNTLKKGQKIYITRQGDAEPECFVVVNSPLDFNGLAPLGESLATGERRVLKAESPGEKFFLIKEDSPPETS